MAINLQCHVLIESRRSRFAVRSALYLAQGVSSGFIAITLAAAMAARGYSTRQIAGLLAVTWIPWALKIFYGPFVDHFGGSRMGRRRPWLLIAQIGMFASLVSLFALPGLDAGFMVIGAIVFVHNLFNTLQDVATDALAVDVLEPQERGVASGAMWSGKLAGIAIGAVVMGTVLSDLGWKAAIAIPIGLLAGVAALTVLIRERTGDAYLTWPPLSAIAPDHSATTLPRQLGRRLSQLRQGFRTKVAALLGCLAVTAPVPTRMMVTFGPSFTVQELGWTSAAYAQFAGSLPLLSGATGALLGGWFADRFGRERVIGIAILGIMLAFIGFAVTRPWWRVPSVIVLFFLVGVFLDMTIKMALQAIIMRMTQPDIVASQFAIYMMLGSMGNVLGSAVLIPLDAIFDARMIFLSAALLGLLPLLLLSMFRAASGAEAVEAKAGKPGESPGE